METDHRLVQERIEAFELDDPRACDPFSKRLARENRWTEEYTQRLITEYKRFLVLAITADHPVTPSEQIDQAWHLHITYTADYRKFCGEVLGRQLDHAPSKGGLSERAKYVRDYERTLASYFGRFKEFPSSDFWPPSEQRFGADLAGCRVNLAEHWVVRKPRVWRWLVPCLGFSASHGLAPKVLLALASLSTVACAVNFGGERPITGPEFLRLYLVLWVVSLVIAFGCRFWERRKAADATPLPELDPYEIAHLSGGARAALDAALAALLARGALDWNPVRGTLRSSRDPAEDEHPFEREIHAEITGADERTPGELRNRCDELTGTIAERLETLGLTMKAGSRLPLLVSLAAPLIGIVRVVSRLGTDKPIGGLVVLTIVGFILAFAFFRPRPGRTSRGDATLAELKRKYEPLRSDASTTELTSGALPIAFGLFGMTALGGFGQEGWSSLFERPSAEEGGGCGGGCGDAGGGDSGGDGGGGCGGGCGGCGGGCGGGCS